jgi:hypothetical protein
LKQIYKILEENLIPSYYDGRHRATMEINRATMVREIQAQKAYK